MSIFIEQRDRGEIEKLLKHKEFVDEAIGHALTEAGIRGKKILLDRLTREGKTGVLAVDPEGVVFNRSAPGQSPSRETGTLRATADYIVNAPLQVEIGAGDGTSELEYADYLEFGTEDGKLLPRPYVKPTLEAASTDFLNDVVKYTKDILEAKPV